MIILELVASFLILLAFCFIMWHMLYLMLRLDEPRHKHINMTIIGVTIGLLVFTIQQAVFT